MRPQDTAVYVVRVISPQGCTVRDTVQVNPITEEVITAGPDLYLCIGEEVTLMAEGPGMASWTPASYLDDPSSWNPAASPPSTTTFTLDATIDACRLQDTMQVIVTDKVIIEGIDQVVCSGDSVILETTGNASNFLWFPSDLLDDPLSENPRWLADSSQIFEVIGVQAGCEPEYG